MDRHPRAVRGLPARRGDSPRLPARAGAGTEAPGLRGRAVPARVLRFHGPPDPAQPGPGRRTMGAVPRDHRGRLPGQVRRDGGGLADERPRLAPLGGPGRAHEHPRPHGADRPQRGPRPGRHLARPLQHDGGHGGGHDPLGGARARPPGALVAQYTWRRFSAFFDVRAKRGSPGAALAIRSATCSPTAGPCLKPWPEPPPTSHTSFRSGWRSIRKSPFDVFSYWQTRVSRRGAVARAGKRLARNARMRSTLSALTTRSPASGSKGGPWRSGATLKPRLSRSGRP